MDISAALAAIERGQAVSRTAWGDADKIVRAEVRQGDIVWGRPSLAAVAVGPQTFTQADLDADDWFIVAAIN